MNARIDTSSVDSPAEMLQATRPRSIFMETLLTALKRALISFFLALPIGGIRLQGFGYVARFKVPLIFAASVFFVALVVACLRSNTTLADRLQRVREGTHAGQSHVQDPTLSWKAGVGVAAVAVVALAVPFVAGSYVLTTLILAMIYMLLGLGLSIVVGMAGLLDLGYVAFYAIGAYTMALGGHYFGFGLWLAIPVAAVFAGIAGGLLAFPVLRTHGDYLAIVTLGFGEIIRLVLNNWASLTGGPNGLEVPSPTFFGLSFARKSASGPTFHEVFGVPFSTTAKFGYLYLVLLLAVCLTIFVVGRLRTMPIGRAWEALREDQIACGSLGLNHVTVKLTAFVIGATMGGVAGVFFASYQGFVNPSSFVFVESALILAIVVLGGMGSTVGIILAALFLTIVPELLRGVGEYRLLALGMIMVLLMLWSPRGLVRVSRRSYCRSEEVAQ